MATKKGKLSMRAVKLLTLLALMSTGALQAQYGWWGSQDTLNLYNRNMGSVMIGATQPLGKLTLGADDQMYNLSLIGDWSNMGKNYLRVGVMGNRSNNLQGHVLFDLTHSNGQARYAGYNFRVNGMSHFFINGDGNVGIGTEKPEARLDIKGGPDWYGFNVGMRMPKNNMIRFDAGQAQYGLVALEDEVSFVTSNGSPTAGKTNKRIISIKPRKVIIEGDLEVTGQISRGDQNYSVPESISSQNTGVTNNLIEKLDIMAGIRVGYNNNASVSMPQNGATIEGNVLIGTTIAQQDYKLIVKGKIKAEELRLSTKDWPDYVFDSKYKLRSLSEVEKFIQQNKHLPDVPSEAHVVEEGVSVVEMQGKLLQKIEELTLYMIDQHKQIEELKKENKILKLQIDVISKN